MPTKPPTKPEKLGVLQNESKAQSGGYGYDARGHAHILGEVETSTKSDGRRDRPYFLGACIDCERLIWSASKRPKVPLCEDCRSTREKKSQAAQATRRRKHIEETSHAR